MGAATVALLAARGATVVAIVRRNSEGCARMEDLRRIYDGSDASGGRVLLFSIDVCDAISVRAHARLMRVAVEQGKLPPVRALVNNAGVLPADVADANGELDSAQLGDGDACEKLHVHAAARLALEMLPLLWQDGEAHGILRSRVVTIGSFTHHAGRYGPARFSKEERAHGYHELPSDRDAGGGAVTRGADGGSNVQGAFDGILAARAGEGCQFGGPDAYNGHAYAPRRPWLQPRFWTTPAARYSASKRAAARDALHGALRTALEKASVDSLVFDPGAVHGTRLTRHWPRWLVMLFNNALPFARSPTAAARGVIAAVYGSEAAAGDYLYGPRAVRLRPSLS